MSLPRSRYTELSRAELAVLQGAAVRTAEFTDAGAAATELAEVLVTKVSRGPAFQFQPRRSLPPTAM